MSDPISIEPKRLDETPPLQNTPNLNSPPLGVRHLLLWTACSASLLSLNRWLSTNDKFYDSELVWAGRSIVEGPALATLIMCVTRWQRGLRFPTQPGEWLLVLIGVYSILHHLFLLIYKLDLSPASWSATLQVWFIMVVIFVFMAISYFFVGIFVRMPVRWRSIFFIAALGMLCNCPEFIMAGLHDPFRQPDRQLLFKLQVLSLLDNAICIVGIAICLLIDGIERVRWGWLHWTGIIVFVLLMAGIERVVPISW